jgi:hypothetical protein
VSAHAIFDQAVADGRVGDALTSEPKIRYAKVQQRIKHIGYVSVEHQRSTGLIKHKSLKSQEEPNNVPVFRYEMHIFFISEGD